MDRVRAARLASFIYGLSVAAALAASAFFLVWPTYPNGQTLVDANGARVLLPLLVPVIVAGLPGLAPTTLRRRAYAAAGAVMATLCVLGGFSIGAAYIPVAVLLLAAAVVPGAGPRRETDERGVA